MHLPELDPGRGDAVAPGPCRHMEMNSVQGPVKVERSGATVAIRAGGNNETESRFVSATQTVYHDADHPSHVLLPVIAEPVFGEKPWGARR